MPVKTKSPVRRARPNGRAPVARRPAAAQTRVAIIGAGAGGSALLTILARDPLVRIVGIAEINAKAPGIQLAKRFGIPVVRDYHNLLESEELDLIIDVTGNSEVEESLAQFDRVGVAVVGGGSAKFMWQLIEAHVRANAETKRYLKKYQELYKLYVKEAGAAVTEERSRIACEIHDGLIQTLVGINFKMELCRDLIFSDPTRCHDLLSDARTQLKAASEESRQVIFNLRPLYSESMRLVPALTAYLKSYETQSQVRTEFKVSGDEAVLSPKVKIFLFRIVQEALSNVHKHAKAQRVTVSLTITAQQARAMIQDNGIGFDVEAVSQDPTKWESFGLKGYAERARLVGGTARIESRKGHGTRVVVDIPVAKEMRDAG
jgi:two-component system, NarL family, sensor histidine kinase DegS